MKESIHTDITEPILHAKKEDTEELLMLYRSQIGEPFCAWTETYPSETDINYDLQRDSVFVMKREGKIIAAISIDLDEKVEALTCWTKELSPGGELSRLAVAKEYQNQGIARQMLLFGMKELKRRGYKSVHFLVCKTNDKALRSYSHLNFTNVGETNLYDHPYWCYEKAL